MHGYEVDAHLKSGISAIGQPCLARRSITHFEKLARLKLIRITAEAAFVGGPERRVWKLLKRGVGVWLTRSKANTGSTRKLILRSSPGWRCHGSAAARFPAPAQARAEIFFQKGWPRKNRL